MKKLLAFFLAAFLLLGAAAAYDDVPADAWYAQAVARVTKENIMSGTSDTTFSPDAYVTRATVVTVLWRMMGSPVVPGAPPFFDVPSGAWYQQAVNWASRVGITAGYDSGDFGPDDQVTREQLAVFLYRYSRYKGQELADGLLTPYTDYLKVSAWAFVGMRHAVGAGLITGDEGANLDPQGLAMRSELATMLVRFMTPAAG